VAELNLIIFHQPGRQKISDFVTIRELMRERAPEIDVFIIGPTTLLPFDFWQQRAELPTALFAASWMIVDPRVRGARLIPVSRTKFEEIAALRQAGFPVPDSKLLTPDTVIDQADWGPFTVIKPDRGSQGRGVRLVRTKDARWRDTATLPEQHPWFKKVLVAQRYIDTGPFPACYRVMTVFGRPIYCSCSTSTLQTALDPAVFGPMGIPIAANTVHRVRTLAYDDDILALGESVHSKLTHTPVMGIDIIREHETGKLYVLELNSSGNTWHISSDYILKLEKVDGFARMDQFGALDKIADAFIEATKRHAI
jgi:hypothetical protein